jgi:hypothetical protein
MAWGNRNCVEQEADADVKMIFRCAHSICYKGSVHNILAAARAFTTNGNGIFISSLREKYSSVAAFTLT